LRSSPCGPLLSGCGFHRSDVDDELIEFTLGLGRHGGQ